MQESKLIWRCRRGVKELDVMFTRFLQTQYPQLDEFGQQAFVRLLDEQDPIILDWLFNRKTSEDEGVAKIIQRLQALNQ